MIFTLRLCILIVILGFLFSRAAFGQESEEEETLTFGWEIATEEDVPEGTQVLLFKPNPELDEHYFLYLESSNDLKIWQVERLPAHKVDANGFVIVEGGAVQRKFWRQRIVPATRAGEELWPSGLKLIRDGTSVTARLDVTMNYHPAVRILLDDGVEREKAWESVEPEEEEAVEAATQAVLERLREIVGSIETERGEVWEVKREIEDTERTGITE